MNSLTAAHIASQQRLRASAMASVTTAWRSLPDYSDEGAARFISLVVPAIIVAQRASASLTAAYLARYLGNKRPLSLDLPSLSGAALRAGTEPAEVYRRPFVTVWSALADGTPPPEALANGLARAKSTAAMDVQLAMRAANAFVTEADPRIDGYARVPDAGACTLCILASKQRYRSGALMPIHNGCGCGVKPLAAREQPAPDQAAINAAAEAGVEPAVHDHGELGPVLAKAGDTFTSL